MTATFGDLIDDSWAHMEIAGRNALHGADGNVSAGIFNAARQLTAMLARCAEDFAGSGEVARPIRQASHLLARWEPNHAVASHPLPVHLSAAAFAWGAAGDVLATHLTAHGTRAPSDWSAVITDQQVRNRIMTEVSSHALVLSAILERTALAHAPDVRIASRLLGSPTIVAAARLSGSAALRAVPLNEPALPQLIPQQPQTPDELCDGIVISTGALRALRPHDTDADPQEWQRTALAASVITHLAARILTQLTRRAYELNPDRRHDLGLALQRATNGIEHTYTQWKGVRHAWRGHLLPERASASTRQRHLDQVTVRLGRLLHANPLWTPARDNNAPLKTPDAIAPTTRDMVPTLRSVLHIFEALVVVAEQDRNDVTGAQRTGRLPTGLLAAHEELAEPKVRTSWALSEALLLAADPDQRPELWQDVHLLDMRRAPTASTRQALRERNGTLRWLEWLSTRTAVSESPLHLSNAPNTPSTTTSATSPPIRRGGSRTPRNRPG